MEAIERQFIEVLATEKDSVEIIKKCVVISNNIALDFAVWLGLNDYKYSNRYSCYQKKGVNETFFYTPKQVLEFYNIENAI